MTAWPIIILAELKNSPSLSSLGIYENSVAAEDNLSAAAKVLTPAHPGRVSRGELGGAHLTLLT